MPKRAVKHAGTPLGGRRRKGGVAAEAIHKCLQGLGQAGKYCATRANASAIKRGYLRLSARWYVAQRAHHVRCAHGAVCDKSAVDVTVRNTARRRDDREHAHNVPRAGARGRKVLPNEERAHLLTVLFLLPYTKITQVIKSAL